jgi:hypothetical protein
MFEYVRITVVQPDSIGFTVDRGDNFHFQLDLDYKINVKLRDAEGTDLTIPNVCYFTYFIGCSCYLFFITRKQR